MSNAPHPEREGRAAPSPRLRPPKWHSHCLFTKWPLTLIIINVPKCQTFIQKVTAENLSVWMNLKTIILKRRLVTHVGLTKRMLAKFNLIVPITQSSMLNDGSENSVYIWRLRTCFISLDFGTSALNCPLTIVSDNLVILTPHLKCRRCYSAKLLI